jgi:Flp pilus assembly protein TadG
VRPFASENRRRMERVAAGLRELKDDCGSGLVEFAIVFLMFMAMILGIIDFGRALYTYHFLSNVTREATRWAAVNGLTCNSDGSCDGLGYMNTNPASATDVQTYVTNHTPPGIDTSKITTNVTWPVNADSPTICSTPATANSRGCTIQVQTSYVFGFLFPFVHNGTMTLSSTSQMIISH